MYVSQSSSLFVMSRAAMSETRFFCGGGARLSESVLISIFARGHFSGFCGVRGTVVSTHDEREENGNTRTFL